MATQNLLQRLDAAAETTGSSVNASDRRIEEVFVASAAIPELPCPNPWLSCEGTIMDYFNYDTKDKEPTYLKICTF